MNNVFFWKSVFVKHPILRPPWLTTKIGHIFGPNFKAVREVPLNFEISALSQSLTKIQTISQFHKSSYLKSTLSRLHERARDDFLHVCPHDEDQMVRSSKKKYKQKVSSFHWCPGAGGWQCTAPASALPTRSTTTTRSRSWAASCSPSPPWSCPTCRTPCPWPYPSLAELSLGKLKSSVNWMKLCPWVHRNALWNKVFSNSCLLSWSFLPASSCCGGRKEAANLQFLLPLNGFRCELKAVVGPYYVIVWG